MKTMKYKAGKMSTTLSSGEVDINLDVGQDEKPYATLANFFKIFEAHRLELYFDAMTKELHYPDDYTMYTSAAQKDAFVQLVTDLCTSYGLQGSQGYIAACLNALAGLNAYNPVEDYLTALPQATGETELKKLFDCLKLQSRNPETVKFAYTFLKKWLMQAVSMALNSERDPYAADFVLVLQGPNGIGKTSFFRKLCDSPGLHDLFADSMVYSGSKDNIMQITKYWICEFGEVEESTKHRMGKIKGFLTAETDEYRAPYGKSFVKYPRRTVYCATVNRPDFMAEVDRRFAVVRVSDIDLAALQSIDVDKLWAEVYALYQAEPQGFRLDKTESAHVIKESEKYLGGSQKEREIIDSFDWSAPETKWNWLAPGELSFVLGYRDSEVGRALANHWLDNGEKLKTKRPNNHVKYFLPPFAWESEPPTSTTSGLPKVVNL